MILQQGAPGEQVADLDQEGRLGGRVGGDLFGLADAGHDHVDRLDHEEEHGGGDQHEVDDVVDELAVEKMAVVGREGLVLEVDAADRPDDRRDQVVDERLDHGAEGDAHDDRHGQLDEVPPHEEIAELLEHGVSFPCSCRLRAHPTPHAAGVPAERFTRAHVDCLRDFSTKEMTMATIAATDYSMPIGGEWVESDGGRFDVTNPATGEVVGTAVNATADDVTRAIDVAEQALGLWKALAAIERGRILRRAADRILAEADHIAGVMTDEQGKPLAEARGEVVYAASFLEWFAGEAERVYGMTLPPMNPQKRVLVLRQPVGVTAAITPWNFPAAMMTRKLGPALAAGCTMIVKPASATPLTALEVVRCMEEAGVPAGVVNVITSRRTGDVASTLFGDPRVRKISFTGSTEVGKDLIRASADQVKRLSLELGGHAPFIVFEDADITEAVDDAMASKYRNAGQTCVCANRIYVQRSIHAEFVKELARRAAAMKVGNGREEGVLIGPLIDDRGVAKAEEHVKDALAKGAELVVGGHRLTEGAFGSGSFYEPTVLDNVTED